MSDNLNFLLTNGMPLRFIEHLSHINDWTIEETANAFQALIEQGQSIEEILAEYKVKYSDYFEDYSPAAPGDFFSFFKSLDCFEEQEATWVVDKWIPEGQITLLAADGGIGKTSLWVDIAAALSSGKRCVIDPPEVERSPQTVAFLTTEDSVEKKLHKKLRLAGADLSRIITANFAADKNGELNEMKFGSDKLKAFIRRFKPALCIFDPVQGFIPPTVNMASRNAMRDCMAPLVALGEETGCTFIIICHTNKRRNEFGRNRIADSADLWDIARSVLMAGKTADGGIRYLSQEKNNYEQLQQTKLFSIDCDGLVVPEGETWKRDRDFMTDFATNNSAPVVDDIKERILSVIDENGGEIKINALEDKLKAEGYKDISIRRAKEKLRQSNDVKLCNKGFGTDKAWYIKRNIVQFAELPF